MAVPDLPPAAPNPFTPGDPIIPGSDFDHQEWWDIYIDQDDDGGITDLWQASEGNLAYENIHPPAPKTENWGSDTLRMHQDIVGAPNITSAVNAVGQYQAELLGDDTWSPNDISEETGKNFAQTFTVPLASEINEWQNDWGSDIEGGGDWKQHGDDRAYNVDYQFLIDVESEFRDKETELGINTNSGIIDNTFTGYGNDLNYELLKAYRDSPDDAKSDLFNMGPTSTGASGEWFAEDTHIKETLETDKKHAKENFDKEKESITDTRKERARTLRGQFKGAGRSGLRRGGGGMGSRNRANRMANRGLSKDMGLLREKARKSYTNEIDRLNLQKDADIATNDLKLENKMESELRELIVNIEAIERKFHIDDKQQEDNRLEDLEDAMARVAGTDPDLWPMAI